MQLRQILRCLVSASKVHDLGGDHNQKKAYLLNTSPPLCNGASYISWTLETWELLLVYKGSRRCSCISSKIILWATQIKATRSWFQLMQTMWESTGFRWEQWNPLGVDEAHSISWMKFCSDWLLDGTHSYPSSAAMLLWHDIAILCCNDFDTMIVIMRIMMEWVLLFMCFLVNITPMVLSSINQPTVMKMKPKLGF